MKEKAPWELAEESQGRLEGIFSLTGWWLSLFPAFKKVVGFLSFLETESHSVARTAVELAGFKRTVTLLPPI